MPLERLPPISSIVTTPAAAMRIESMVITPPISVRTGPQLPPSPAEYSVSVAAAATTTTNGGSINYNDNVVRGHRRKESHKEVERRRRNIINEGYENLRKALIDFENDGLAVSFEGIEEDSSIYKNIGDKIRRLPKGRLLELTVRYLAALKGRISTARKMSSPTETKSSQ